MTSDGWGKPKGWTTQQAVDKAVEKLNVNKPTIVENKVLRVDPLKLNLTDTVKEVAKAWPKQNITEFKNLDNKTLYIVDQSMEAAQVEIVNDPTELEFLLARQVQLNLGSKLFKTDGLQVGDLVIHDEGEYVVISHVPTLRQFMQAVPTDDDKEYTDDQLVKWCTKVQLAHKEDWAILRALTYETSIAKDAKTMEAASHIRDWCLSVEIE